LHYREKPSPGASFGYTRPSTIRTAW
jgi:hypothetical protein